MATVTDDLRREVWREPRSKPGGGPVSSRAEWLWTLLGIALVAVVLFLVVDNYLLRSLL